MPSYPLDGKHGQTTSGVTCHHRLWTGHTVERRQAWHAIIAFGKLTRSNDVGRGMMTSPPLDSTHGRMMLGVTCQHRLWTADTVERRRVWNYIIAFGQHTRSNDMWSGMPLLPLGSTNGRTSSGMACHHRLWAAHTVGRRRAWHDITVLRQHTRSNDVGPGMTSPPLDNRHGRTTSGVA